MTLLGTTKSRQMTKTQWLDDKYLQFTTKKNLAFINN